MIQHPLLMFIFVLVNVGITLGYAYLAFRVIPHVYLKLKRTKIGGVGFFVLCGLTHLDLAFSALFHPDMPIAMMATSWHMLGIHVPQVVCVWLFVTGLYIEVGNWAAPGRKPLQVPPTAPEADSRP